MALSKRLQAIYNLCPKSELIADIGSDHASLPLELLDRNKANRAFLVENKMGPFSKMKSAVTSSPFQSHCICSLSDGISSLPNDTDTILISGMGGQTMIKILLEGKDKLTSVSHLLLEPQSDLPLLLETLNKLGFVHEDYSCLLESGKFYEIFLLKKGKENLSPLELTFGPLALRRQDNEWRAHHLARLAIIEHLLNNGLNEKAPEKLLKEAKNIMEALKWKEGN